MTLSTGSNQVCHWTRKRSINDETRFATIAYLIFLYDLLINYNICKLANQIIVLYHAYVVFKLRKESVKSMSYVHPFQVYFGDTYDAGIVYYAN